MGISCLSLSYVMINRIILPRVLLIDGMFSDILQTIRYIDSSVSRLTDNNNDYLQPQLVYMCSFGLYKY